MGTADADLDRRSAGCRYAGAPREGIWYVSQYFLWVEEGNCALTDLPPWMADVARLVRTARARSRAQQERDRRAKQRCREMLADAEGKDYPTPGV